MKRKHLLSLGCLVAAMLAITACGAKEQPSVEEEVANALLKDENSEEIVEGVENSEGSTEGDVDSDKLDEATGNTSMGSTSNDKDKTATSEKPKYGKNPFLGDESTATSYNIKFSVQTDSGVSGINWGSQDGTKGEYYVVAFDCTREFPRLYTCRKNGEDTYDENYTNLDFMYPEMKMFTDIPHIIEIKADGTKATVYLDSYVASEYTLNHETSVGQIGTWVMEGDYHEIIDDLFVAEGVNGDGDWIYSEDFSGKTSIFSPDLSTSNGKLYAVTGYHTVPKTELMK